MSAPELTAAPLAVTYNDTTYSMRPLAMEDLHEFVLWLQDQKIELAKRNLAGLEEKDRQAILARAYDKAEQVSVFSPDTMQALFSPEGAAKAFYLSLRGNPGITQAIVNEMVQSDEVRNYLASKMEELNKSRPFVDAQPLTEEEIKLARHKPGPLRETRLTRSRKAEAGPSAKSGK
jgi:hypothetical protein